MATAPLAADAGDAVTVAVRVGPVLIERSVEALQASAQGAVFVRDEDGHIFSTVLAGSPP
jgi:hypothetical protein